MPGGVKFLFVILNGADVDNDFRVIAVFAQGFSKRLQRMIIITHLRVYKSAGKVKGHRIRKSLRDTVEVAKGAVILLKLVIRVGAVEERINVIRRATNGAIVTLQRMGVVLLAIIDTSEIVPGIG